MSRPKSRAKLFAALFLSTMLVQACAPVVAGSAVGGAAGYTASGEGGVGQVFSDSSIANQIHDAWFTYNRDMFDKLFVTVFEGRVLIVGSVQTPDYRDSAIRFAWQAKGVRQVINEIRIEPAGGISGYTRDAWIGARLRTRLLTDGEIQSRNYKFETNKGTIYMIGVARDQEELDRAINHARNISYVRDVVSYVRLRSDVRPNEGSNAKVLNAPQQGVVQDHSDISAPAASPSAPVEAETSYTPPAATPDISTSDLPPVQ